MSLSASPIRCPAKDPPPRLSRRRAPLRADKPTGTIFAYDPKERRERILGQVDPIHFFSPVLVDDREGVWYAFGTAGRLMRFSPFTKTIEATDLRVE